jgi:hypothetical protein
MYSGFPGKEPTLHILFCIYLLVRCLVCTAVIPPLADIELNIPAFRISGLVTGFSVTLLELSLSIKESPS